MDLDRRGRYACGYLINVERHNVLLTLISVLHAAAALGAIVFWCAGMHFWYLLNSPKYPGVAWQRKWRFRSFVAMLVLGLVAWGLRLAKESLASG